MARLHNFSAGPSPMPTEILDEVRNELLDYQGLGASLLEVSHRSDEYTQVEASLREDLTALMGLGDDWHILLLQGGASMQFHQVPLNFLQSGHCAGYLVTGQWAQNALDEALLLGDAYALASSEEDLFSRLPAVDSYRTEPLTSYIHFTSNNTIYGTQFHADPQTDASIPLVCDASSDFLGRPVNLSRYNLIYAGAQKNLGPSGVTIVLVRKSYLETAAADLPTMLSYRTHAGKLFNTPPVFATWIVSKVLRRLREQGGVAVQYEKNKQKAATLYAEIDRTGFYRGTVTQKSDRSLMNVTFRIADEALEKAFITESEAAGFIGLKGYRAVGGMRASLYNAVEQDSVDALVGFMREFERVRG
jgi:phosphoserine aminotransferase